MDKAQTEVLLNTLQEAVDLAAKKVRKKSRLLVERKGNTIFIGNFYLVKQGEFFDIFDGKSLVCESVGLVDSAIVIIERLLKNKNAKLDDILADDNDYCKQKLDMMYYSNSYKTSRNGVFIDRFLVSQDRARNIKGKIQRYGMLA